MAKAAHRKAHPGSSGRAWMAGGIMVVAALLGVIVFVVLRNSGGAPAQTSQSNLPPAPDIDITLYQGQDVIGSNRIALSRLWERRPVVLNFWAGLCPPCRVEMPDFQRFYAARKDKVILIGVDIGPFIGLGSREDGKALLRELKVSFPAGTTFDARTVRNYQVLGMPTTVFITSQGRIFRKYTGLLTREQMDGFLNDLLKASGVL